MVRTYWAVKNLREHYTLDYETTEQKENINQLDLIHLNAVLALVRFSL